MKFSQCQKCSVMFLTFSWQLLLFKFLLFLCWLSFQCLVATSSIQLPQTAQSCPCHKPVEFWIIGAWPDSIFPILEFHRYGFRRMFMSSRQSGHSKYDMFSTIPIMGILIIAILTALILSWTPAPGRGHNPTPSTGMD